MQLEKWGYFEEKMLKIRYILKNIEKKNKTDKNNYFFNFPYFSPKPWYKNSKSLA